MRVQQSCVILSCAVMLAGCVSAQQTGPAPSAYPVDYAPPPQVKTFVFPEKGQSPEQQEQDDFTCYKWAKQQTGYDPEHPNLAAAPPPPSGGGALFGAMGGAALGAIGGAIAGDPGMGAAIGAAAGGGLGLMGQRAAEQEYQQDVQQAGARNQRTRDTFDRAHRTCMEAKGYKVG
ncbi:hypothetical protein [Candidatus Nitrospira allomarina]|uniref:Glycine zipper domain-containing protein n=1 Tax=Candidatus Nitrospira allomarina TaxID=3020900 RepID=A0AA96JRI0_9BACT|nr:hypothetical protein [Candidatus Nitrospira allomarina]WNM57522.1 hypothetical protein PP769_16355 [Candidatus Nitrospira allomarina]